MGYNKCAYSLKIISCVSISKKHVDLRCTGRGTSCEDGPVCLRSDLGWPWIFLKMGDTSQIYWRHWHWYLSIGKMMINTGIGFHFSRTRPQPFAWGPHGRAYGKFCKRGHFWVFPASRSCVSRGRRGTSWHSNVFRNVSKVVVCVWQAQYFCDVFRRCVAVFVVGAALWTCPSSFCVAGAAL